MKGVSIIICCFNSSKLLPQTLKNICRLKSNEINIEVILVDNASDDDTAGTAKKLLDEYNCPFPFKIIQQPVQGLSFARKMGLDNSQYEYILFCDDDNLLDEQYVSVGFEILENDISIGSLGGQSRSEIEGKIPQWFKDNQQNYSVGKQAEESGDITWSGVVLWGAGMFIRTTALKELYDNDFRSLLTDRKGNELSSGGDSEICYALRLAGWKIWYDERLIFKHFLPAERLKWSYLRKLNRGFGAQKVDFDPYLKAFDETTNSWQHEALRLVRKLRGYGFKKLLRLNSAIEGDADILRIEKTLGRLSEIFRIRGEYDKRINLIRNAKWRKVFSQGKSFSNT